MQDNSRAMYATYFKLSPTSMLTNDVQVVNIISIQYGIIETCSAFLLSGIFRVIMTTIKSIGKYVCVNVL